MDEYVYAAVICDRYSGLEIQLRLKPKQAVKCIDAYLVEKTGQDITTNVPYNPENEGIIYSVSVGHEGDYAFIEKLELPAKILNRVDADQLRLKLLSQENKRLKGEKKRLENLLFKAGAMNSAPCFICGYNGPEYFHPERHKCAARHHRLYKGE